jgi:hypothetical protein
LQQAVSDLREAVRAVSSNGQIEAKKAEELTKRVDELDKHLTEKRGEDAGKKVEDLDKYLTELSRKGELSPEGEQQIKAVLQTVRDRPLRAEVRCLPSGSSPSGRFMPRHEGQPPTLPCQRGGQLLRPSAERK